MNTTNERSLSMTALRVMCEDESKKKVVLDVLECIATSYVNVDIMSNETCGENSSPEKFLVQELEYFRSELTSKK